MYIGFVNGKMVRHTMRKRPVDQTELTMTEAL